MKRWIEGILITLVLLFLCLVPVPLFLAWGFESRDIRNLMAFLIGVPLGLLLAGVLLVRGVVRV
jgi:hypothetical protein